MISSSIVRKGTILDLKYPCVKQWQNYNTCALFSSENQAVLISVDEAHTGDFVGKIVEDCSDPNWKVINNYEIVIHQESEQ